MKQPLLSDEEARDIYCSKLSYSGLSVLHDVSLKTVADIKARRTYWWILPTTERMPTRQWIKYREYFAA